LSLVNSLARYKAPLTQKLLNQEVLCWSMLQICMTNLNCKNSLWRELKREFQTLKKQTHEYKGHQFHFFHNFWLDLLKQNCFEQDLYLCFSKNN